MSRKKGTQLSVQVTDQLKLSYQLEAAALELADRTSQAFHEALAPLVTGSPPEIRPFKELIARWLAQSREQLIAAEARYAEELRVDRRMRERRNEASRAVITKMRVVKAQLDEALGTDRSESIAGFGVGLQEFDTEFLVRVAKQAVAALRQEKLAWVKTSKRVVLDFESLANQIEEPLAEFEQVLLEQQPSLRRTLLMLATKERLLLQLKEDNRRVAAFLNGCYRFAKMDFEADRLRPSRRESAEVDEEPPSAEPVLPVPAAEGGAAIGAPNN